VIAALRRYDADDSIHEPAPYTLDSGEGAGSMASRALGHQGVLHCFLAILAKEKARNGRSDDGPSVSGVRQGGSEHPRACSQRLTSASVRWRTERDAKRAIIALATRDGHRWSSAVSGKQI
jgi:hypothetical protein